MLDSTENSKTVLVVDVELCDGLWVDQLENDKKYDDRPGLIEVRLVRQGEGYKPWV